jgi:hypothetical protein
MSAYAPGLTPMSAFCDMSNFDQILAQLSAFMAGGSLLIEQ